MASIRDLKKELKYTFGELVEEVLLYNLVTEEKKANTDALIKDIYEAYDAFVKKINAHRKEKDKKAYFRKLNEEIEAKVKDFTSKIEALY